MRKLLHNILIIAMLVSFGYVGIRGYSRFLKENKILHQVIERLQADSRIAEVLVTKVEYDEPSKKNLTTIKFLEYDVGGNPLSPRYFTFAGNIIQFQSLVIRFDDIHIRNADKLRGKSAHLFWKVFMLDGPRTQEYDLTGLYEIPAGYKIKGLENNFEAELWSLFWKYALQPDAAQRRGIKNAQIEAPGMMFVPGMLYTIKIEHDGGIRIDATPLPAILKGERIP